MAAWAWRGALAVGSTEHSSIRGLQLHLRGLMSSAIRGRNPGRLYVDKDHPEQFFNRRRPFEDLEDTVVA